MINEAPYDKEKKKGQPLSTWERLKYILKYGVALFVIGNFLACGFYVGAFLESLFKRPDFSPEEVSKICSILDLSSDSAFCSASDSGTFESLILLIEQTYPPGSITVSDLSAQFSADIQCDTPEMDGYLPHCLVGLSSNGAMLYIDYDDKDHVVDYGIVDWEGSLHR